MADPTPIDVEIAEAVLSRTRVMRDWEVLVDCVPVQLLVDAQLRSVWTFMVMAMEHNWMHRVPGSFEHKERR